MAKASLSQGWRDHVIIMGGPGTGRTLWARAQAAKVPFRERALRESACEYIYRASGLEEQWREMRPTQRRDAAVIRAPHYTASERALCGTLVDGWCLRPGEVSRAHGGVLFLDDVVEFPLSLLAKIADVARRGTVLLGSAAIPVPAEFRLIAASAECPCGLRGQPRAGCRCSDSQVGQYLERLRPLRDVCRIVPAAEWQADLHAAEVTP